MRTTVTSPEIAPPAGPYSHAVVASGDVVYLCGQTGQDASTGELVQGGVAAETQQALENLEAVLRAAGLEFGSLVKCNVFLVDIADFPAMNAVYAQVLPAPHPARTTVGVTGLALGARVEIECVAVKGCRQGVMT
jgi:2-iminobutanoate/2-iminopropanoate deaminase